MKPKITEAQCSALRESVYRQIPGWQKAILAYGFGGFALGYAAWISYFEKNKGFAFIAIILIAGCHYIFRNGIGHVDCLGDVDRFDVTPSRELLELENDPEAHAMGVHIKRGDWPDLFKTGLRVAAIKSIETTRSKSLSVAGYLSLFSICLFGSQ